MGVKKVRLGELIEPFSKVCNIPDLCPDIVSGINSDKEFFEPSHQVVQIRATIG